MDKITTNAVKYINETRKINLAKNTILSLSALEYYLHILMNMITTHLKIFQYRDE